MTGDSHAQSARGVDRAAVQRAKGEIRERVWALLDEHRAVDPPGAAGHIPAFVGGAQAAERLVSLAAWQRARVIKCNPDRAQLAVRVAALTAGKHVYMAVPKLATSEPFFDLNPEHLPRPYDETAASKGAATAAPHIALDAMQPIDLVVCGTVAVDTRGVRIGKGAGYSDLEVALLHEAGLVGPETTIITTVHDLQVLDEELPAEDHDFHVDVIVTPTRVLRCPPRSALRGIDHAALTSSQRTEIPILALPRNP